MGMNSWHMQLITPCQGLSAFARPPTHLLSAIVIVCLTPLPLLSVIVKKFQTSPPPLVADIIFERSLKVSSKLCVSTISLKAQCLRKSWV